MKFLITLVPQFRNGSLRLECKGSSLFVNGEEFDFSPISVGDILPPDAFSSDFFAGEARCDKEGEVHVILVFPAKRDSALLQKEITDGDSLFYDDAKEDGDEH